MFRWLTHLVLCKYLTSLLFCTTIHAQSVVSPSSQDTQRINQLNLLAQQSLVDKQAHLATRQAKQALQLAQKLTYEKGQASSLFILGKANQLHKRFALSLNFFLQAKIIYEKLQQPQDVAWVYYEVGKLYLYWQSPQQALTYYQKAYQLPQVNQTSALRRLLLDETGDTYHQMSSASKAIATYQQLLKLQQGRSQVGGRLITLKKIAQIHTQTHKYAIALAYQKLILKTQTNVESLVQKAVTLDNMGNLYKQLKQPEKAIDAFKKALSYYRIQHKQERVENYEDLCAVLLTNIGVTYNFLQEPVKCQKHFEEALVFRKKGGNQLETARLYNLIATNYCIQGNVGKAKENLQQAIEIAQASQNKEVLQNSYKVYIRIYEQNRDSRKVKAYYKRLLRLKEDIEVENRSKLQTWYAQRLAIEKKENDYRLLLAEEEKQAYLNQQLRLESQKKEQTLALKAAELTLLREEQAIQQSKLANELMEKKKVKQLLSLAEQKLLSEEQRLLMDSLRNNQKLRQLAMEKQQAKDKERQQRLALQEKDKKLRQQILHEERVLRRNTFIGMAVFLLLISIIIYQFRKNNKMGSAIVQKHQQESQQFTNKLMKINERLKNKEKILKKNNAKLAQQSFEIKAYNFILSDTIDELGRKNQHMQDNLQYAQHIQQAMLPYKAEMDAVFQEHFVIFKPREIVSGDFYWFASIQPKKTNTVNSSPMLLFAVVDCTGHGVPGGFLSMMGFTLLNEIVHIEKVDSPAKILQRLDTQIQQSLKQESNKNNDGMDICFCKLQVTSTHNQQLTFASTKQPLYYVLPQQPKELHQMAYTKHSISSKKAQKTFEETTIELPKGTTLYLSTDGMTHLPNSKNHNFGSRRFKQMLTQFAHLPLSQQQASILQTLRNFQEDEDEQRDDIILMGVKV